MSQAREADFTEGVDLIRTKLAPHRAVRGLLDRPELIERLEDGADNPLTLLRAPAGFGKTTLASQWRQALIARGCDAVWISLDPDDDDETQFLSYLLAALEGKGEVAKGNMSMLRRGRENNSFQAVAAALVNDLSKIETPLFIFIDDYHHIQDKVVNAFMGEFLAHLPCNVHLVVISRTEPAFPLVELRIRSEVTEITVDDLRFDFAEAGAFLSEHFDSKVSSEQLHGVLEATEGWVTALQWVSIAMKRSGDGGAVLNNPGTGTMSLVDTIATQTLDALPKVLEEFLLMTSILDRFNVDLCKAVTGLSHAGDLMRRLEAENLFIIPVENEAGWFRYHPLFAKHLHTRLIKRYIDESRTLTTRLDRLIAEEVDENDHERMMSLIGRERSSLDVFELHRRAAYWYHGQGHVSAAVRHALSAGDQTMMLDIMENSSLSLIEDGELHTLVAWRDRVDNETLSARPALISAFAWAYTLTCQLDLAEELVQMLLEVGGGDEEIETQAKILRCVMGAYNDQVKAPLELRGLMDQIQTPFLIGACGNAIAFSYLIQGDSQAARDQLEAVENDPEAAAALFPSIYRYSFMGQSYTLEGQLKRAEKHLRHGLAQAEKNYGRRSTAACIATGGLVELLYERNNLRETEQILAHRLDILNDSVFPDGIIRSNVTAIRLHYVLGNVETAEELFKNLCEYGERRNLMRPVVAAHAEKFRYFIANHDVAGAQSCVQRMKHFCPKGKFDQFDTEGEIVLLTRKAEARLMIETEQFEQAAKILDKLIRDYAGVNRRLLHTELNILQGITLFGLGRLDEASSNICRALQAGEQAGLARTFLDEADILQPVIAALSSRADFPDYLARFAQELMEQIQSAKLRAEDGGQNQNVHTIRNLPDLAEKGGLSEREFEILELLGQGMPNKRIAMVLDISAETVKWHLKRLYLKLEVSSRLHAVDKAKAMKLI